VRATPIRVVEPVQPSDDASRNVSATTQRASLDVHVQDVSLTFQTADGEVQALSNVDLVVPRTEGTHPYGRCDAATFAVFRSLPQNVIVQT
jgi:hypothetical protein